MTLQVLFKSGILAGALSLAPLMAGAATFITADNYFGGNGSEAAHIASGTPGVSENVLAGGFSMTGPLHGGGNETFTAWCLDIVTYMQKSANYVTTDSPFQADLTATQKSNIEKLFETGFSGLDLTIGKNSAGFQLALWELVYETGSSFDLASGNFQATGGGAIGVAGILLGNLGHSITQSYELTWLQAEPHISQNLVTASEVPLPAGGLLLAGALAGLAAWRRRKAA